MLLAHVSKQKKAPTWIQSQHAMSNRIKHHRPCFQGCGARGSGQYAGPGITTVSKVFTY